MAYQVATDDHLYPEGLALIADGYTRVWHINHPIGHNIFRRLQELGRNLVEHLALVRNGPWQHHIKSRYAVGSHHDQVFFVDGVYIANLAPVKGLLPFRSEEHTSELQSLMRISYAVFCLK